MLKTLKENISILDTEKAELEKKINEHYERINAIDEKRSVTLNESLQTLSDEECQLIEEAVYRLFKLYNYASPALRRIKRDKFSITTTSWNGHHIVFDIVVKLSHGEECHQISEHHGVFKDFEAYFLLRKEVIRTQRVREKARALNNSAMEKVNAYIEALPSDF